MDLKLDGRTQRQIKELKKAGYDVTIIYHQKFVHNKSKFYSYAKIKGIKVRSRLLPKSIFTYLIMYLEFCLKAIFVAFQEKADIIQANNLDALLIARFAVVLKSTPLIYDAQEISTEMQGVKFRFMWIFLETILLKRVNVTIDVNQERARLKQERYSLYERPIVVLNCPETCSFDKLERNALKLRLYNLGLSFSKAVIYQGAIMQGRHLDKVVQAMKYVNSDVTLVLMGPDNGYCKELKILARISGQEKRVVFLEPIQTEKIVPFISGADIGILFYEKTSLNNYYCAPTKLYEYLMAGLPIIVNDLPHLKNLVSERKLGKVLFEVNPMSISHGINELLKDEMKLKTISKRAKEITAEHYNWRTQAEIYIRIFRGLSKTHHIN